MNYDAELIIRQELGSNERLSWSGVPKQGVILRPSDALMIPFSIMWCGFAIFWEASVIKGGAPFFFMIWGIPFVFVGLYFVFGRFIADARIRSKTYYGITNERIIIITGLFRKKIKSINFRTLSDISLTEKSNGRGTITFGNTSIYASFFGAGSWPGMGQNYVPAFELVENAKIVYEKIRNAQSQ